MGERAARAWLGSDLGAFSPQRHQPVHGDRGQHHRRDQAKLCLVCGQDGARGRPRDGGRCREEQVHGRDPHAGGDPDARAARDRGLDQQQADRSYLHRDCNPGRKSCDERGRQVHELR